MSSKTTRKTANTPKPIEPIITRTKSAQQRRQLRNKGKKGEKPKLTKIEPKSPKKPVISAKKTVLKSPVKNPVVVLDQAEYYPNKLKRNICSKKIMLKPKHNFKVIASTNKRKLATPQKGIKSPLPKPNSSRSLLKPLETSRTPSRTCSSPELSMQDMVRMMEETRSLSDEDFMEILTCPSPVWWEDPPDGVFDEDSINTRSPEPPPVTAIKETTKRKMTKTTKKTNDKTDSEQNIDQFRVTENKKDEKFVKKKQKLENILGNIKNKSIKQKHEILYVDTNTKFSESECELSDMSFNEEEILKTLENIDIPIEKSSDPLETNEIEIKQEIKEENELESKNDNVDRVNVLSIEMKPEIKNEFSVKSTVFDKDSVPEKSDCSLEEMSSNTKCEIDTVNNCKYSSLGNISEGKNVNSNSDLNKKPKENSSNNTDANSNKINNIEVSNKKTAMSEFITIYKIMPEKVKTDIAENDQKVAENSKKIKPDNVRGKLDNFFRQCKNNKRLLKDLQFPAIPFTDVKEESTDSVKENGGSKIDLDEEENRLKCCDDCVGKTENGITVFSCEKCKLTPILPCDSCNFLADSKEMYRNHISTCKEVPRIAWRNNCVLNQT